MKNSLYQLVFSNVYLSTKIFATIHQLQKYKHSFKYDDIVNVTWMCGYNHLGLLKEKIKRNIKLYVDCHYLYVNIANSHPDIFIQLFESYRYHALAFTKDYMKTLNNVEVIKYLVERGFGVETEIDSFERLYQIDLKALQYLLENKLCTITFRALLLKTDFRYIYSPTKARETKEKIEFLIERIKQSPITIQDSENIIESLIDHPTPLVLNSIEPFLDPGVSSILFTTSRGNRSCSYEQAVQEIRLVESERFRGEDNWILFNYPGMEEWYACVGKGEQEFINTWNRLENRIRIIDQDIEFVHSQESVSNIGERLFNIISLVTKSLRLVHFLISKGLTGFSKISALAKHNVCQSTLKHHLHDISQQDRDVIITMGRGDHLFINLVLSRFTQGYFENFNFFFKQFTQNLDIEEMHALLWSIFDTATSAKNVFLYESIEAMGNPFPIIMMNYFEFQPLLSLFGRVIDSFPEQQKNVECSTIFLRLIQADHYIGFKYVFTKCKLSPFLYIYLLEELAKSRNLVFIDYLWKNISTCFIENSSPADIDTFFTTIFNFASTNGNIPLLEYMVKNNCIDTNATNILQEPYFTCNETINPKYRLDVLVHFIENRFFDSIDPYVVYLLNPSSDCSHTLVEYIYRNQDKFNTQISFQHIFDQLVAKNGDRKTLSGNNLKYYDQLMDGFMNRYGCQLKTN